MTRLESSGNEKALTLCQRLNTPLPLAPTHLFEDPGVLHWRDDRQPKEHGHLHDERAEEGEPQDLAGPGKGQKRNGGSRRRAFWG